MDTQTKIQNLIIRADTDDKTKGLMEKFFNSIAGQSQYDKIIDLFEKFPSFFDNFVLCFKLKKDYFEKGGTAQDWNDIIAKEEEALNELKVQE